MREGEKKEKMTEKPHPMGFDAVRNREKTEREREERDREREIKERCIVVSFSYYAHASDGWIR